MFTLTSTATKIAVLSFTAGLVFTAFNALTLGFQGPTHSVPTVELPTVVVVGYRASVVPDTLQAAAGVTSARKS